MGVESSISNGSVPLPVSIANGGTSSTSVGGAQTALGMGSAALQPSSAFCQTANNLSDVTAATALSNLGGLSGGKLTATNQTSNFTMTLPANAFIIGIFIKETAGNAITGGLRIGTTNTGTDVVIALSVGANSIQMVPNATLLKQVFSTSATQQLFLQAVTLFNSASITVEIIYGNL